MCGETRARNTIPGERPIPVTPPLNSAEEQELIVSYFDDGHTMLKCVLFEFEARYGSNGGPAEIQV